MSSMVISCATSEKQLHNPLSAKNSYQIVADADDSSVDWPKIEIWENYLKKGKLHIYLVNEASGIKDFKADSKWNFFRTPDSYEESQGIPIWIDLPIYPRCPTGLVFLNLKLTSPSSGVMSLQYKEEERINWDTLTIKTKTVKNIPFKLSEKFTYKKDEDNYIYYNENLLK